jgi:3-dehydroquinate synthase
MARKSTEAKYPIKVVEDAFAEGGAELAEALRAVAGTDTPRVAVVADANVVQRTEGIGRKMGKFFQDNGVTLAASPVVISGGEKAKADNFQSAMLVANSLLDAKVGANDVVIALGGGSVLDVAGYAAAQVRGGVKVLRMPTTVAAMIDAAFADYAAVDSVAVKDAFRVRCEPAAVVVDPLFAKTVLDGVWRAGFAEAVRYASICDGPLMKRLAKRAEAVRARDYDALKESISECVASRGGRQYPPFALWCAARLEAMSAYKLPHGYAVAIAICVDCAYAVKAKKMKESDQELVCRALADCGALDGLAHSHHILSQHDSLLKGLDALALSSGSSAVSLPGALGKCVVVENPDRVAYVEVIADFLSVSRGE